MYFGRWMDKLEHPNNGILLSTKKKWAIKPWKDMEESKCVLVSERKSQKSAHCMIPTLWHSGKGKTRETVKDQWLSGVWGEGGMNRWSTGDL